MNEGEGRWSGAARNVYAGRLIVEVQRLRVARLAAEGKLTLRGAAYPAILEKSAAQCIARRNSLKSRSRLRRSGASPAFTVTLSKNASTGARSDDRQPIAASKEVSPVNSLRPVRSKARVK